MPAARRPQARLERARHEEALALMEMRKAVEHLQRMEGQLAARDAQASAPHAGGRRSAERARAQGREGQRPGGCGCA